MSGDGKTILVQTVMTPLPLQTARPTASVKQIAEQMKVHQKGAIVIVDVRSQPLGIVTERDVVRRVVAEGGDRGKVTALDVMSKPIISVNSEISIYDAALVMTKYKIRRLPTVRDNVLHGMITATDLAKHLYEKNKKGPTRQAMSRYSPLERP